MTQLTIYHIPVCPFSQRLEILLSLKGLQEKIKFQVIDITKPRPAWLLEKTRGTTSLPVLETAGGEIIKESLVIMQYLEDIFPEKSIAQHDPYKRAVENMMVRMEGDFVNQGYMYVLNQNQETREALKEGMLKQYARLNDFLLEHSKSGPFLFDQFGWAEAVFTPFFMRFWFLEYFEDFELPTNEKYARVQEWINACTTHTAAQQVSKEEIIKLYYDYAKGAGNAGLLPGRRVSSFTFEPHWRTRPWPPKDKYNQNPSDEELGLKVEE